MNGNRRDFLRSLLTTATLAVGLPGLASEDLSFIPKKLPSTLILAGGIVTKPGFWAEQQRCGASWNSLPTEHQDLWKFFGESIRQTGKQSPTIVVISAAAGDTDINKDEAVLYGQNYVGILRNLSPGSKVSYIANFISAHDADDIDCAGRLREADLVVMTGGAQSELIRRIGRDTLTYQALVDIYHLGECVIAGTSAGAMVMTQIVPNGGSADDGQTLAGVLNNGYAFLQNIIVDTHFFDRGRFQRLAAIIAEYPGNIGIGVDERACLILKGDLGTVFAEEGKHVYVMLPLGHPHKFPEEKEYVVNENRCTVYRFAHGETIDLKNLRIATPEEVLRQEIMAKQSKSPAQTR